MQSSSLTAPPLTAPPFTARPAAASLPDAAAAASADAPAPVQHGGEPAPAGDGSPEPAPRMSRALAATLAAGAYVVPLALSLSTSPGPQHPAVFFWYRSLRQPAFKPPDIAIPIAWVAIETALAWSAYRVLRAEPSPDRTRALGWWAGNIVAIGSWSRLFFGRRNLAVSTVTAAAMVASGAALTAATRRVDAPAAAATVPYTAWVAFATVLTAAIWRLNPRR